MKFLVSACLLGVNCKYSGGNNLDKGILEEAEEHLFIPVCPEQLGGLSTPRCPAEIINGEGKDVLENKAIIKTSEGNDVTEKFVLGAYETLKLAKLYGCEAAILKQRSPSCGCGSIYDGSYSGKLREGNGVCAQLLLDNGIKVYTEEDYLPKRVDA